MVCLIDPERIAALEKQVADLMVEQAEMKLVQAILIDQIAPEYSKAVPPVTRMGPCGHTMQTVPHKGNVCHGDAENWPFGKHQNDGAS